MKLFSQRKRSMRHVMNRIGDPIVYKKVY